jgi:glyoxylase-like metal-dependent hydrolase (beta-lactamase superfamily II)
MIVNEETKETLIIDPGAEAARLSERIRSEGLLPVAILLTHGHFDHAGAVAELKEMYKIPVYAHEEEKKVLEDPMLNLTGMWSSRPVRYQADIFVRDGDILELAGFTIRVIFTPGHTQGGCCYYFEGNKVLASGDTLFHGSIGRTDFPGGSMSRLVRGIREKLLDLPGDTEVLPGHDMRTTIGYEKQYNPFL